MSEELLLDFASLSVVVPSQPILSRGLSNPVLINEDLKDLTLTDIGFEECPMVKEEDEDSISAECPICSMTYLKEEIGVMQCCSQPMCDGCLLKVMYLNEETEKVTCPFCVADITDTLPVPKGKFLREFKRRGRPRRPRPPIEFEYIATEVEVVYDTQQPPPAVVSTNEEDHPQSNEEPRISPITRRYRERNREIRLANQENRMLEDLFETEPKDVLMLVNFLRRHYQPDYLTSNGYGTAFECCCGNGAISNVLRRCGWEVIERDLYSREVSHNFLTDEFPTEHFDIIITNPPYASKKLFFKRCVESNKPFALFLPIDIMFLSSMSELFSNGIHILIPTKRVRFTRNGEKKSYGNIVWFLGNFPFNRVGDITMEYISNNY